ncbi:MAG TPA: sensor histidine kinase [Candidatus Hypogeohydataceae bacterium YC41]
MEALLSPEHKITERRYMRYQPFGIDELGNKIEDVRGHVITSTLEYVKELAGSKEKVARNGQPPRVVEKMSEKAAKEAGEKLISMLNSAISDKKYQVTEELLKNPWNSYSTEFFQFMVEFAKEITGEKDFCFKLGFNKLVTPLTVIIGKPFPLEYIYKMVELEERFSKGVVKLEAPTINNGRAIMQIKLSKRYKEVVGEHFLACAENTCLVRKGSFVSLPYKLHNMPPAQSKDTKCIARGDEYCEMELTWETRHPTQRRLILLGVASSVALFFGLTLVLQSTALKFTLSILPLLVCLHIAYTRRLAGENLKKERLISEQQKYLEDRFKDLEDTNIRLQATNIELNERLRQLAETQERLLHAEKLAVLGRLSSYVSHELRNPLTSMKNALYYFKRKISQSALAREDPKLIEFLEILDKEVDASTSIINHILDFTKIRKLSRSKGDLASVLKHSLSRRSIPEGVKVLEEIPLNLPTVWIDTEQLAMVFGNLIQNAYEAMPQGGMLEIKTRASGEYVEVEFTDTGHGIPEENLKKIFEPFFTSKVRGTGLGLSICKEVVERHGGSITVKSTLGAGSTFAVGLPVAIPNQQAMEGEKTK